MIKASRCSVETCDRALYARGYCKAHYSRLHEYGDVRAHVPLRKLPTSAERGDIVQRIMDKATVNPTTGCIEWHGLLNAAGYGQIGWNSRRWLVHRAMWTATVGPIPTDDDWTLDHLCFNRACVNVKHIEVVTRIENSRRGGGLPRAIASNKIRYIERCKNGHKRTAENTVYPKGVRNCLTCRRAAYAKRRAQAVA